jgi:Cft2 family RNA processing exonuclease
MIDVHFQRGIELPGCGLWLDPKGPKPIAFVSHAHSDHLANHREVIASAGTTRLMQARMPARRSENVLPFGVPCELRGMQVTLLPAGHILGSAQIHLQSDHGSLLYTGDFKLRPSLSAEATQWKPADTLIMETTFGLPRYCMPPTDATLALIIAFCRESLEAGAVPVLLAYSLGKSQEVLCALLQAGLIPMLHASVFRMTEIYRELTPGFPSGYEVYSEKNLGGKVLIWPPSARRTGTFQKISHKRTAVLTGWALDPGATYRYQADAAFPLSDHADYPDLLRYVELVNPRRVYTVHGFATAFAQDLRARGIEAWALGQANQLELAFSTALSKAAPQT